ncbi:MAG TPA: hypothetical protein VGN97_08695 [Mesorhizobium sp.]|jgi:hypothetical protein|nr:hypothetical protein [Mesorhizobium sp.]
MNSKGQSNDQDRVSRRRVSALLGGAVAAVAAIALALMLGEGLFTTGAVDLEPTASIDAPHVKATASPTGG